MKRSDIIKAISDNILSSFMPEAELRLKNLIADCMLAEAEKLGMLPPEVMKVSPGGTFIDVNGIKTEYEHMNTFDNNWEQE